MTQPSAGGKGRVYLAGPMRGHPHWNARVFDFFRDYWRDAGWNVVSPIDLDRRGGLCFQTTAADELLRLGQDPAWLRQVMMDDVGAICGCDALAALPGWEHSSGAAVEIALALFLGLPVYAGITMRHLLPAERPWSRLAHGWGPLPPAGTPSQSWADMWRVLSSRREIKPDCVAGAGPSLERSGADVDAP